MVQSFYSSRQPGGENHAVLAEIEALRGAGHEVAVFSSSTDDLEGQFLYRLGAGMRVATGYGNNPKREIESFAPDIVHVQNLFPNFGRHWVASVDVPLVHTLHNYRPLCANGLLYRDGSVCTLCPDGARLSGLRYRCYRDSRMATLPLTIAGLKGVATDPVVQHADAIIVLSTLQRDIYVEAGIEPRRLSVAPNFLPDDLDPGRDGGDHRHGWLFAGRLSSEKGVLELIDVWPKGEPLKVVGDGPLAEAVAARASDDIEILGRRERSEVIDLLRASEGLIFPSRWYEPFGLVYMEALATGTPVVAFAPSAPASLIPEEGTGLVADWNAELMEILREARQVFPRLAAHCRDAFETKYSEEAFIRERISLYRDLIDGRPRGEQS